MSLAKWLPFLGWECVNPSTCHAKREGYESKRCSRPSELLMSNWLYLCALTSQKVRFQYDLFVPPKKGNPSHPKLHVPTEGLVCIWKYKWYNCVFLTVACLCLSLRHSSSSDEKRVWLWALNALTSARTGLVAEWKVTKEKTSALLLCLRLPLSWWIQQGCGWQSPTTIPRQFHDSCSMSLEASEFRHLCFTGLGKNQKQHDALQIHLGPLLSGSFIKTSFHCHV